MNAKKNEELQVLRAFAILAVIAIHTTTYFTLGKDMDALRITNIVLNRMSTYFAVPCFVFISGFVLAIKYKGNFRSESFYYRRFVSTVPQYLIFSLAYMVFADFGNITGGKINISVSGFLSNLVSGSAYFHLWFFVVLFQLYMIYPVVVRLYEKYNVRFVAACLLVKLTMSSLVMALGVLMFNTFPLSVDKIITNIDLIIRNPVFGKDAVFVSLLFWFVLGIHVSRHYGKVRAMLTGTNLMLLGFGMLLSAAPDVHHIFSGLKEGYNYSEIPKQFRVSHLILEPLSTLLALMFFLALSIRTIRSSRFFAVMDSIGYYSLGIYLVHAMIIELIRKELLYRWGIDYNSLIFYPLTWVGSAAISYFAVYLISLAPFSGWIIGVRKKKGSGRVERAEPSL
ncbi:MAG: acyltransferase [Nitrospirae bacterium]|nr:acyltransferase [Nitrospirota bacterium]